MSAAMKAKGFTLVELLVVVAIVALLASIAAPLAEMSWQRGKEQELRHALRQIREAIDAYKRASDEGKIERKADASGYPPNLAVLVDGVEDKQDPEKSKIFFLRRVPRDPMTGEDWGLRSYASPANDPQPGKDVYDVYSRSEEAGLNRVPYREW
jgi:general secretion pathway protein G